MTTREYMLDRAPEKVARAGQPAFEPEEERVFARGLTLLNETGVPYAVAGAVAKHAYTGIWRDTKDLDVFLPPRELEPALEALRKDGFDTSVVAGHWLAKARRSPYYIDLIFGVGHGRLPIDASWVEHARPGQVAGVSTRILSLEELIASKAYIAERDRYDGPDIAHLVLRSGGRVGWERVLQLLGSDRVLLLWHLLLFDFVYPGRAELLPQELMVRLFEEARAGWSAPAENRAFRGMLLDPFSFAVDVLDWGYEDRRDLDPLVDARGARL